MKKRSIPLLALILAFVISGCRERSWIGELDPHGAGAIINKAEPESVSGKSSVVFPVVDDDGFEHLLFEGDNTVEHEFFGYCGNTITKISRETGMDGKPLETSFWGGDSVALTDLLRYLDYGEDVCECLPEYNIKTEFGNSGGYGVSLTKGFARYDGKQVSLTEEQIELIRDIIDRHND